jgi:hypothetical protein
MAEPALTCSARYKATVNSAKSSWPSLSKSDSSQILRSWAVARPVDVRTFLAAPPETKPFCWVVLKRGV